MAADLQDLIGFGPVIVIIKGNRGMWWNIGNNKIRETQALYSWQGPHIRDFWEATLHSEFTEVLRDQNFQMTRSAFDELCNTTVPSWFQPVPKRASSNLEEHSHFFYQCHVTSIQICVSTSIWKHIFVLKNIAVVLNLLKKKTSYKHENLWGFFPKCIHSHYSFFSSQFQI